MGKFDLLAILVKPGEAGDESSAILLVQRNHQKIRLFNTFCIVDKKYFTCTRHVVRSILATIFVECSEA